MKRLATFLVLASCLGALAGCITPQTYDEIHTNVYEWSPAHIDQQFPQGTLKKAVFARLGDASEETAANGLLQWKYQGDRSDHQSVTFIFRDDRLIGKQYGNL